MRVGFVSRGSNRQHLGGQKGDRDQDDHHDDSCQHPVTACLAPVLSSLRPPVACRGRLGRPRRSREIVRTRAPRAAG